MASFNYRYIFVMLKNFFLLEPSLFDGEIDSEKITHILNLISKIVSSEFKINLDERFINLKHFMTVGEDGSNGIVIEFCGPFELACECNYVALVTNFDNTKVMYTSELYSDSMEFKLCETLQNDTRLSYNYITNDLNAFLAAIKHKIV